MEKKDYIFKGGLTRLWWIPLITGLLAITVGIWCLCDPVSTLPVLAYFFAAAMCVAGCFNFVFSLVNAGRYPGWGWGFALGLLELISGVWLFCMPQGQLTVTFMYIIGLYMIFAVVNAIADACTFYGTYNSVLGWLIAILVIALFFAIVFLAGPVANGIAIWVFIGISLILFGGYRIGVAALMRKINKSIRF